MRAELEACVAATVPATHHDVADCPGHGDKDVLIGPEPESMADRFDHCC